MFPPCPMRRRELEPSVSTTLHCSIWEGGSTAGPNEIGTTSETKAGCSWPKLENLHSNQNSTESGNSDTEHRKYHVPPWSLNFMHPYTKHLHMHPWIDIYWCILPWKYCTTGGNSAMCFPPLVQMFSVGVHEVQRSRRYMIFPVFSVRVPGLLLTWESWFKLRIRKNDVYELYQIRQTLDFEALKLWKGRSGTPLVLLWHQLRLPRTGPLRARRALSQSCFLNKIPLACPACTRSLVLSGHAQRPPMLRGVQSVQCGQLSLIFFFKSIN